MSSYSTLRTSLTVTFPSTSDPSDGNVLNGRPEVLQAPTICRMVFPTTDGIAIRISSAWNRFTWNSSRLIGPRTGTSSRVCPCLRVSSSMQATTSYCDRRLPWISRMMLAAASPAPMIKSRTCRVGRLSSSSRSQNFKTDRLFVPITRMTNRKPPQKNSVNMLSARKMDREKPLN